jgi:hypothetical protein
MSQHQGHFCRICHTYRAHEKFSGQGHRQHICKDGHRERQVQQRARKHANKRALEAGVRPLKKSYPKNAKQAARYWQISLDTFALWREKLALAPCEVHPDAAETVALYDMEMIVAIHPQLVQDRKNAATHSVD